MKRKYKVKPEQEDVLKDLEKMISNPIPRVKVLVWDTFGVKVDNENIIGLGLYNLKLERLPETFGNLNKLQVLEIFSNELTNLPESLGNLKSLEYLNLEGNELKSLPNSIGNLESLQYLNLQDNQLVTLPESFGNLKLLQTLVLRYNQIKNLPESFGRLRSLNELYLWNNNLTDLPESFGGLQSLKKLYLSDNDLTTLPDSFKDLKALQLLELKNNKLKILPLSIWGLNNLKSLEWDGNPWEGDSKEIAKSDIPTILDFCRKNAHISIFISHAVTDFNYFRIKDISKYLEQQEEIYRIYYCEEDLKGNIDEFMNETVPKCQLMLFFGSKKSVFDSDDCDHEIDLARKHEIQVIPIKGEDLKWEDLIVKNLNRELGIEFQKKDFDGFCDGLYKYIEQYKRDKNLFDSKAARFNKQRETIKNTIINITESNEFKENLKENLEQFEEFFQELNNNRISTLEYFFKCAQILFKKSKD
ncbi:MAG: leucine-rich repeat domain-containing protein [Promethearchaeota archaeon]